MLPPRRRSDVTLPTTKTYLFRLYNLLHSPPSYTYTDSEPATDPNTCTSNRPHHRSLPTPSSTRSRPPPRPTSRRRRQKPRPRSSRKPRTSRTPSSPRSTRSRARSRRSSFEACVGCRRRGGRPWECRSGVFVSLDLEVGKGRRRRPSQARLVARVRERGTPAIRSLLGHHPLCIQRTRHSRRDRSNPQRGVTSAFVAKINPHLPRDSPRLSEQDRWAG